MDIQCLECEHCIDDDESLYCLIKKCIKTKEIDLKMENNKKCIECANSRCEEENGTFTYVCCLSKTKCAKCLSEVNEENYFREM